MVLFFFGIANRFVEIMRFTRNASGFLILRMRRVPSIDATGIESLEIVIKNVRAKGMDIFFTGVNESVRGSLRNMGTEDLIGPGNIFSHLDQALAAAQKQTKNKILNYLDDKGLTGIPAA